MSIRRKLTLACTITGRRTPTPDDDDYAVDEYNNPVAVERTSETKCYLEQTRTAEEEIDRNVSDSAWLLLVPADVDIDASDAVTVDEFGTFEVAGEPWPVWNPRKRRTSHIEARLRRTA